MVAEKPEVKKTEKKQTAEEQKAALAKQAQDAASEFEQAEKTTEQADGATKTVKITPIEKEFREIAKDLGYSDKLDEVENREIKDGEQKITTVFATFTGGKEDAKAFAWDFMTKTVKSKTVNHILEAIEEDDGTCVIAVYKTA